MRALLLLLGLACSFPGHCGVTLYKWVDRDGTTHFSDQPHPGAEAIVVQEIQTVPPLEVPAAARPSPATEAYSYDSVTFTSPANEETIRDNSGNVSVTVAVTPPLRPDFGHRLTVLMDGGLIGESESILLTNVDRGTHSLTATVVDGQGKVLASGSSTFHLQRHSVLNNAPAQQPANAPGN